MGVISCAVPRGRRLTSTSPYSCLKALTSAARFTDGPSCRSAAEIQSYNSAALDSPMSETLKPKLTPLCSLKPCPAEPRPSREQAARALRTLILWAGDDPDREGMRETPARVARAFEDWFSGYDQDPEEYLRRTFEEVDG